MKVNEGGGVAHEQENIDVMKCQYEVMPIDNGQIKDAKTIMLQYAKINNLFDSKHISKKNEESQKEFFCIDRLLWSVNGNCQQKHSQLDWLLRWTIACSLTHT
jgi:hypothetical protein